MTTPETVRDSSLPKAVASLSHSLEGQSHPWLLMMLQNLCHRVVELQDDLDNQGRALSVIYHRLSKLERCNHDD
jgi:hypothetical protein